MCMCGWLAIRPGISVMGTIMLLCIWSASTGKEGGFEKDEHRASASELLRGLIGLTLQGMRDQEFTFVLTFDTSWAATWPRPPLPTPMSESLPVKVSRKGIHLEEWQLRAVSGVRSAAADAWFAAGLAVCCAGGPVAPLHSTMRSLSSLPSTRHLAAQVVWQVARNCEAVLTQLVLNRVLQGATGSTLEWVGFDEALSKQHDLDKRLARYTASCRESRVDWQYMSCVTDKGDGGGLTMAQTLFAFPDNHAFVGVPQVDRRPLC